MALAPALPPDCSLSVVSFLGHGAYGDVYLAKDTLSNNKLRALKIIDLDRQPQVERHLLGEIKIMEMLSLSPHPSLLRMIRKFNVTPNGRKIGLVLQYCDGGDLQKYVESQPGRKVTESEARELMSQLACGLRVLKKMKIIHRDLKPANLLLKRKKNGHLQLKIADFGFAKALNDYKEMLQTLAGSPLYVAPEILLNTDRVPYSVQCDLWSVGIILHELLTSRPPFQVSNRAELQRVLKEKGEVTLSDGLRACVTAECCDLLSRLLQKDPKKRISWDDFFSHIWLGLPPITQSDIAPLDPIAHRILCIRAVFNLAKRSSDFDMVSQLSLFMEVLRALEKLIVSVVTLRESAETTTDQEFLYGDDFAIDGPPSLSPASLSSSLNPPYLMEIQEMLDECYRTADVIAHRLPRSEMLPSAAGLIYQSALNIGRKAAIDEGLGIGNSSIAVDEYSFAIHLLHFVTPDVTGDDMAKVRNAISRFEKIYDSRILASN